MSAVLLAHCCLRAVRPAAVLAVRPAAVGAGALRPAAAAGAVSYSSRRPGGSRRTTETSVFVQNGAKISELPVVVKPVRDVLEIYRRLGIRLEQEEVGQVAREVVAASRLTEEEREVIEGFSRCVNSSSIFRLLETVPPEEVTPPVAAFALRKILELEEAPGQQEGVRETIRGTARRKDTFLRIAFVNTLVEIILGSGDPAVILDGLDCGLKDGWPGDREGYRERLVEEVVEGVAEGLFSLPQVCRAVHTVSQLAPDRAGGQRAADRLWVGVMDKGQAMRGGAEMAAVFGLLPRLAQSRHMVLRLLEEKVMEHWQQLETQHVIEILRVLTQLRYDRVSPVFLRTLSGWLALHIHQVEEREMLAILWSHLQLDYTDTAVIKAVEKMVRVKGLKIQDPDLISTICTYVTHFRIRSPTILEGVGQYLMEQHHRLQPAQVGAISQTFGQLDFHPPNGFKFWELLENYLEHNFVKFAPFDIINMLVSFLYIERYPLNFTNKLFNPYFLERLHNQPEEVVARSRAELKLFDSTMNLSCKGYEGPMLPKDNNYTPVPQDQRVARLSSRLLAPLADVVGGGDTSRLARTVLLAALPLHPLFIVDLMIYPSHAASLLRFGFHTNNSSNTAVLVLTPEHYDRTGKHLMGGQVMRVRHLKRMGFKVMMVKMTEANKLMVHPRELKEYLQRQYLEAQNPPAVA